MTRTTITAADVLDAAQSAVDQDGFESLSVRRVALILGVSRQVVYTHHGSMKGLLDALHRRASGLLAADVGGAAGPTGTREHLHHATTVYVRGARQRPTLYQLLFGPAVPGFQPSEAARRESLAAFGHLVAAVDAYLHGIAAASTEPADPHTWPEDALDLAQLLWAGVHGLVDLERAGHIVPARTDRLAQELVDRLTDDDLQPPEPADSRPRPGSGTGVDGAPTHPAHQSHPADGAVS